MGLTPGLVVEELGWDEDVDEELRSQIMDAIDGDLVEESDHGVDVVLVWWRFEDGDVVDALVDGLRDLTDTGYIWLLTPKFGQAGHVSQADVSEGAVTAGLSLTSTATVSKDWAAHKIVRPKGGSRR
ncbi:MAG: DUF3052 domain-containing protein [Propionibacteriaceae bacterium]|jgi:hypothetical protein|nr:DUF3052 domain-containing protein [Propionibacteriaceae bacterium]